MENIALYRQVLQYANLNCAHIKTHGYFCLILKKDNNMFNLWLFPVQTFLLKKKIARGTVISVIL